MAHQQWSSSTAVDGVWEALIRRSSSASFGVKGWGWSWVMLRNRLAPEYKFPVLPYDAYDSVRCIGILGIGAEDVTDDCVGCKECSELWCKPSERLHCWWILWPVTLQGTMNLNRVSLGCSFAHLLFPTKWMTGRGRWTW